MKKILFALILCLPLTFIGQGSLKTNGNSERVTKVLPATYAEILVTIYSPKEQKITIDFGAKKEQMAKKSKAAQTDFLTVVDALNAMSMEGFKLIDSYEVLGEKTSQLHFILVQEIPTPPRKTTSNAVRPVSSKKK